MSEINVCSICQEEKKSYFRKITETAKLKAEKGGYYDLHINDLACSKCYNNIIQQESKIQQDDDKSFKTRKSTGNI